jgi:Zn-dependent peptidase ImmA (M78 family)
MANLVWIADKVEQLVKKYDTRNPFEIAESLNIAVRYIDLGYELKAYYVCQSRIKNIVLNNKVNERALRLLAAHELGHAILHKEIAALKGFQEIELFDVASRTEYEANIFAAELLIDDDEVLGLLNDPDSSFFGVASTLGVPAALLDFKFRLLKSKGYRIEPIYLANADFLKKDIDGCFENEDDYVE